jgi:hypothetical protein
MDPDLLSILQQNNIATPRVIKALTKCHCSTIESFIRNGDVGLEEILERRNRIYNSKGRYEPFPSTEVTMVELQKLYGILGKLKKRHHVVEEHNHRSNVELRSRPVQTTRLEQLLAQLAKTTNTSS